MCVMPQLVLQQSGVAHSHPFRSGAVLLQFENPCLHVYWHVVPLQSVVCAFVPSHCAPHIEQSFVVFGTPQSPASFVTTTSLASPASFTPASCTSTTTTSLPVSGATASLPVSFG